MRTRNDYSSAACPCGNRDRLDRCCGPLIDGLRPAGSPEALMRSRYTAFVLGTPEAVQYLLATHHPEHRDPELESGLRATVATVDVWEDLQVLWSEADGDRGTVEFVATFRMGHEQQRMHERSQFVREGGRWLYTTGELL